MHNYYDLHHRRHAGGAYGPARLANLGIGHGAVDAGVGYTYFNPQTGHEFSAVFGATYNLKNYHTDYQNGIDLHPRLGLDSQFLTKQAQIGLVGLCLQAGHLRQRRRQPGRLLQIAGDRRRSADRLYPSDRYDHPRHLNLKG